MKKQTKQFIHDSAHEGLATNSGTVIARDKIFWHEKELKQFLQAGFTQSPIVIQVDPTNLCNLMCRFCAGGRSTTSAQLEWADLERIIDQFPGKAIEFTGGGEPLLNKFTAEAMVYAKSKGKDVALIFNGTTLREEDVPKIISSATYIRLSYGAALARNQLNPSSAKSKRAIAHVHENLTALVNARNNMGSPCTIGMSYLTDDADTYDSVAAIAETGKMLGADYVKVAPLHESTSYPKEELKKIAAQYPKGFIIIPEDRYEKKKGAYPIHYASLFRSVVCADGEVTIDCFTRGRKNFSIGNLLETDFTELWGSPHHREVLRTLLQQPNCPPACNYDPLSESIHKILTGELDPAPMLAYAQTHTTPHVNFV